MQTRGIAGCRAEKGAMMLFVAAVILPLLFLFFAFTLDIEKYFRDKARAQHAIDEAGLYAFRLLPDVERARQGAQLYLNVNASAIAPYTKIQAAAEGLSLSVEAGSRVSFASFFGGREGSADVLNLPVQVYSRVQGAPLDAFVAMDASAYLAPELGQSTAWGEAGTWPSATLFAGSSPHVRIVDARQRTIDGRLLTQQCFNPVYSVLKRVTIALYETLAASAQNAVGIGFFPGGGMGVDIAREILPRAAGSAEAVWVAGAQTDAGVVSDYCLAAAHYESAQPQYWVPAFDPSRPAHGWRSEPAPAEAVLPGAWLYNPDYAALRVREVVWAQAVRPPQWQCETEAVLEVVAHRLGAARALAARGALRGSSLGLGVIIAGDVPRKGARRFPDVEVSEALRAKAAQLATLLSQAQTRLGIRQRIYYALLSDHPGLSARIGRAEIEELSAFFRSISSEKLEVKLIVAPRAEVLERKGVESLLAEQKVPIIVR